MSDFNALNHMERVPCSRRDRGVSMLQNARYMLTRLRRESMPPNIELDIRYRRVICHHASAAQARSLMPSASPVQSRGRFAAGLNS